MTDALEPLLKPFQDPHSSGEDLRYSAVYDTIQEARRQDDGRLTQGVWEQDIKQANWAQVQSLSAQALENQSKDLHLVGWLGESWIVLQGLKGLQDSLLLVQRICEGFWETLYPHDPDDPETRVRCLEWLDGQWAERLNTLVISQPSVVSDQSYTFADWVDGQYYAHLAQRASGKTSMATEQAQRVSRVKGAVEATDPQYYQTMLQDLATSLDILQGCEKSLKQLDPESHTFTHVREKLEALRLFLNAAPSPQSADENTPEEPQDQPHEESAPSSAEPVADQPKPVQTQPKNLQDRQQIYEDLGRLIHVLKAREPHSPVVPLLQTALQWKDLSFLDILKRFEDVGISSQHVLKLFHGEGQP